MIESLLIGLILASIAYCLVCMFAALSFFTDRRGGTGLPCPPVSVMVPLCGVDFEAYDNYASLCRLDYPVFEIVFGVKDPRDSSVPVVRRLMKDFPHVAIQLVVMDEIIGENPKVNNLNNMLAHALYEHIVIVDSDVRVGPDLLRKVVPPLFDNGVGLVTCFYRAGKADNLASMLEAVGIAAEFAPGVLVANLIEGMTFSLGAVMATSRERLNSIGGLRAIADYLADDFMLGNLLWKAGYRVKLLPYVVETIHPHVAFMSMLKHQIRWGRGIRACRPIGYWGSIVTHGTSLALIHAVITGGALPSLFLLAAAAVAQLTMGRIVAVRCLGEAGSITTIWMLAARDLFGFLIWCLGLAGQRVEWRGKIYRLVEQGKIVPAFGRLGGAE